MATLRADLSATSTTLVADVSAEISSLWKVDNESVRVMGCYQPVPVPGPWSTADWYWVVQRARGGTAAATHSTSATLTAFYPESGTTSGGGPHTHPESEVTSLVTDLAGKAATHTHPYEASGAVATHAGLADPHPGYLTPAEGNAAYAPTHSHPYAATSHAHVDGDLPAGLARDSEVAAAYSALAHVHSYAPVSHAHLDADIPAAIARDAEVTSAIATHAGTPHGGSLPAGLIVMWGGLVANIPAGWILCNGQNGTPDLRDRFVKGAAVEPGATGGSATHTHAAHTGVINHTHPVTDPGHTHLTQRYPTATGALTGFTIDTSMSGTLADNTQPVKSATTGVTTTNPAGGVASLTHDSPNSEPAYYALCFIQKT